MEPAPGNLGTSSEDVTIKSRAPLTLPSHLPLLRATSDLQAASLLPLEKPERRAVPRAPRPSPGASGRGRAALMQWDVPGVLVSCGLAGPASCSMGLGSQVSQHQGSWPGTLQPPRELGLGPCSPRPWGVTRAAPGVLSLGSSPPGTSLCQVGSQADAPGGLAFSGHLLGLRFASSPSPRSWELLEN